MGGVCFIHSPTRETNQTHPPTDSSVHPHHRTALHCRYPPAISGKPPTARSGHTASLVGKVVCHVCVVFGCVDARTCATTERQTKELTVALRKHNTLIKIGHRHLRRLARPQVVRQHRPVP